MSVQSTSRIIALEDGESEPLLPGLQDSTPPTPESFGGLKRQPTLNTPLLTLVLILLVVSAVMSGLFAASITRNQGGNRGGEETTVCLNSSCVLTAARILNSLDKSIDPCENFYNFANGGWLRENPVPEDKALYGIGEQVTQRNKRILQTILDAPPSTALPELDLRLMGLLKSYYKSCAGEETIASKGSAPLMDMINEFNLLWRADVKPHGKAQTFVAKEDRRDRLTAALAFLHAREIPSFFEFYLEGDVKLSPSTMLLWLQQSGLSLPSKDYYKDIKIVQILREKIEGVLTNVYTRGLGEIIAAGALARGVVDLEIKLAAASLSQVDSADPELTYNKFNSEEIENLFPHISFKNYFAGMAPRPSYPGDDIIVMSPSYLAELSVLVDQERDEILEAYFIFKITHKYATLLGDQEPIKKEIVSLDSALTGIPVDAKPRRSDVCLTSLLDSLGFLAGRFFVLEAFDGASKTYAEEIFDSIVAAFQGRLPELGWLDRETRLTAAKKAESVARNIGYPDSTPINTTDPNSLVRYYFLNLPVSESDYYGNVARSRMADQKRLWASVGKQRDGKWEMIPSEVNAYYNPSSNEVVFPAGILQNPYFNRDWPEYLVYGSFGSIAGHELSHAFDSTGRQYNAEGKLTGWWSKSTIKRFEKLKQCFLKQYANYTIIENGEIYHVNSELTIGEDMADSGGLAQAYKAWTDRLGDLAHSNYLLPGLDYSREQLFFISYSQGWARGIKPEEAIRRIRVDPHSPTAYRVNGPLSNDLNFMKAFNCKAGSAMSRVDKCQIW